MNSREKHKRNKMRCVILTKKKIYFSTLQDTLTVQHSTPTQTLHHNPTLKTQIYQFSPRGARQKNTQKARVAVTLPRLIYFGSLLRGQKLIFYSIF